MAVLREKDRMGLRGGGGGGGGGGRWGWAAIIYTLLDGLAYNTRGYFASCEVFFRAPKEF